MKQTITIVGHNIPVVIEDNLSDLTTHEMETFNRLFNTSNLIAKLQSYIAKEPNIKAFKSAAISIDGDSGNGCYVDLEINTEDYLNITSMKIFARDIGFNFIDDSVGDAIDMEPSDKVISFSARLTKDFSEEVIEDSDE
jgi:hypothetical protein